MMEAPFMRSAWNYDRNAASLESGLLCPPEEGMTQQQFAEEADINTIVRRFGLTGQLPDVVRVPQSGDFTGVTDYATALRAVREADEMFMELPGELRARFDNNPQKLLRFMQDEANRPEAEKLGLVNKPVVPGRDVVQAVDELAAVLKPKPGG